MKEHRYLAVWCLLVATAYCAAEQDEKEVFEQKYQAWRAWIQQHPYLPTYSANPAFSEIVNLGVPALPYIMEKMQANEFDFHLERAVRQIAKKKFEKSEWPAGRLGDSRTAAKMFMKWWKEGRKQTSQAFEGIYRKLEEARAANDQEAIRVQEEKALSLGIVALPYMVDIVKRGDTGMIPLISKLTDRTLRADASAQACLGWWEKDRVRWSLPD